MWNYNLKCFLCVFSPILFRSLEPLLCKVKCLFLLKLKYVLCFQQSSSISIHPLCPASNSKIPHVVILLSDNILYVVCMEAIPVYHQQGSQRRFVGKQCLGKSNLSEFQTISLKHEKFVAQIYNISRVQGIIIMLLGIQL